MREKETLDLDASSGKQLLSWQKVIAFWVGSSIFTIFLFSLCFHLYSSHQISKKKNLGYLIKAIVQTGPEKSPLPTNYLAELLDLSSDQPTNLFAFDIKKGEQKLLNCPLIKFAKIRRLPPNALYIDYQVRKPYAFLADYENMAIDRDGYIFPMYPFFSPKSLPEIYLGLPAFSEPEDSFGRSGGHFSEKIDNKFFRLSSEIIDFFSELALKEKIKLKKVDVSLAFAPSLGKREIVLSTEEEIEIPQKITCIFPKILRLPTKDYLTQIQNFLSLRKTMVDDYTLQLKNAEIAEGQFQPRIIDLRISQLAFVEN